MSIEVVVVPVADERARQYIVDSVDLAPDPVVLTINNVVGNNGTQDLAPVNLQRVFAKNAFTVTILNNA